ncbi:MAG: hypothetical protein AAB383_02445 [Patescibacteria group bacterium]
MFNILVVSTGASEFDLDEDGMPNEWEEAYGLNPNDASDASIDLDRDGLTSLEEYTLGTDPLNPDTDGDIWGDEEEIFNGTDPLVFEAADLDVLDIIMNSATGEISYVVTNLGNLDVDYVMETGATTVYLNYGEEDEAIYSYDWNSEMTIGTWTGTFFLTGSSETISTGLGLISGEHSVMVCIDPAANHGESVSELENCEIESFTVGPDLTVTDISFEGDSVYVDLANIGDFDANAEVPGTITTTNGVSEQIYAWTDLNDGEQDFLSANGTTLNFESFEDTSAFVDGDTVQVCVDSNDLVNELNESNNCLTEVYSDGVFTVEAGVDEGIGFGTEYTLKAYAEEALSLDSAVVNWGDGAVQTLTQTIDGDRINLGAVHTYPAPETYTVTVCANDGSETVCDIVRISIVGNSSGGSSSSSSSSTGGSGGSSGSDDSSTDEDVDLAGEEDQDVTLTEEEEAAAADCSAMVFEDVSEDDDFYDGVCELWAADILHGKSADFFDAEDVIRRDEASKIFTRWFGYVTEAYGETPEAEGIFDDVDTTDPLAYYVEVAHEEGIVTGDIDTEEAYFMPHDAITAQGIADALEEILGDNEAGEQLDEEGYVSEDTMTRGNFVEFLYGLTR